MCGTASRLQNRTQIGRSALDGFERQRVVQTGNDNPLSAMAQCRNTVVVQGNRLVSRETGHGPRPPDPAHPFPSQPAGSPAKESRRR